MSFWDLRMFPWERRSGQGQGGAGWGRPRGLGRGGFTLLEVVLAIFIVIGMLSVVLYFYQQAARLRSEVLLRIDEVSTARLLMDRLTAELRQAFAGDALMGGLTGTSNSITFFKDGMPDSSAWSGDDETNVVRPSWDLTRISYSLRSSGDVTNVLGVERLEEPLLEPAPEAVSTAEPEESLAEAGAIDWLFPEDLPVKENEDVAAEKKPDAEDVPAEETEALPSLRSIVAEQLRFLHFRYWDGVDWADSWDGFGLPVGVEIRLGGQPLPAETAPEEYPDEVFRRIVYLPGSAAATAGNSEGGLEEPPAPESGTAPGLPEEGLMP